jgi:hypothetical protein
VSSQASPAGGCLLRVIFLQNVLELSFDLWSSSLLFHLNALRSHR